MGTCANSFTSNIAKKNYQTCPTDITTYQKNSQEKRQYLGQLSNVRIQNIAENLVGSQFGIQFSIQQITVIQCALAVARNGKIQWKLDNKFNLALNDYQSRSKFIRVIIKNKQNKKMHEIKINLYRILVGPFHHDFGIGQKGKAYGRIIFDMKISEIISVELRALQASVIFNLEHPGDKFNFILQSNSIANNQNLQKRLVKSIPSYKQTVPLQKKQKYRQINQKDQVVNPTFRLKRKLSNLIKQDTVSVLEWQIKKKNQMPSIQIKIKSCEILSSIYMFKLFKFIDDCKFIQFGQFGFTFSELMSATFIKNQIEIGKQNRVIKIQKNISQNGKIIGKCQMQLQLKFKKFVSQTANCSQTEDGIVSMSHLQVYKIQTKAQQQQSQILQKFLSHILSLAEQKHSSTSFYSRSHLSNQIFSQLDKLNRQLQKNIRNSYVFQNTKSEKLKERKKLLISILDMLAYLIEENDIQLSQLCWKNVICIMKRGEMMLKYWELQQTKFGSNQSNKNQSKIETKGEIQIGLDYVRVLNKLLKLALNTQASAFLNQQKQSCEVFKAFCYFRVPAFRNYLLKIIGNKLDKEKATLRQYQIDKNNELYSTSSPSNQNLLYQLNWQNRFYKFINQTNIGKQMDKQLQIFMQYNQWFHGIVKEDQIYCNFVKYLIGKFIVLRDKLKLARWIHFQGYGVIVKGYLLTMCQAKMEDYKHYTVKTAMSLLQNDKIIYPLLQILYRKTNLYCQSSLLRLAHMLSHFLHTLSKPSIISNNLPTQLTQPILLSPNFPYSVFMLPIKQILQLNNSVSLSYFLTFIYTFYNTFQSSFRYELSQYLLGHMFWKLCYNWSYNIRRIYYHIVILKVGQDTQLRTNIDIQQKLKIVCRIISNAQKLQNEEQQNVIKNQKKFMRQQTSLHKIMKKKLNIRKQSQQSSLNETENQWVNLENLSNTHNKEQIIEIINFSQFINCSTSSRNNHAINKIPFENIENKAYLFNCTTQASHSFPKIPSKQNKPLSSSTFSNKQITQHNQPQIPQLPFLKLSKVQTKNSFLNHKLVYTCFNQSEFMIPQVGSNSKKEIKQYLKYASREFKQIYKLVQEYYQKHRSLPNVDFQFKIQIDEKDILPDQFDDDQFQ